MNIFGILKISHWDERVIREGCRNTCPCSGIFHSIYILAVYLMDKFSLLYSKFLTCYTSYFSIFMHWEFGTTKFSICIIDIHVFITNLCNVLI